MSNSRKKVLSLSADKDFSFGTETLEIDVPLYGQHHTARQVQQFHLNGD
jgi:hypothetical protein